MKQFIVTDQAPSAIGTYSQAVSHNHTLYISGQIPLEPETMEIVGSGINEQISQVFKNLASVCIAANTTLDDAIKFTVYLTNLGDFPVVNQTMEKLLSKPFPARAVVEVSALPKGVLVEVDAVVALQNHQEPDRG